MSRPPCETHGAGHDPDCTACVLVKREAITVAIATVNWLTGGAVSARSQRAWMRAIEAHPFLAGRRSDAYRNLLAVARVIMWCGKRSPVNPAIWTSIPTRARIMAKTGLSETTAKKWVKWLREHGFLATVTEGSTPRFRSTTHGGLVDDGAGNLGAEWALTAPLADAGFPQRSEDDHTPVDQAVSPEPEPISGDQKRPPAGSLSSEREPATDPPVVRRREDRTASNESEDATAWTWPLSATPGTKIDMLQAAQALRTRSAILRKVSAKHLRSLLRKHFRAGWTPNDVLHGLDHRPDGSAWTFTEPPRWLPGWIRHRLAPWHTADGAIAPSLSQQAAARRQAAATARAATAAEREQQLAKRVDASAGPAAAARAALVTAGPKAAAALQHHEDRQPTRLYNVKVLASYSGAPAPTEADHAPIPAGGAGEAGNGPQRPAQARQEPVVPDWIMTEPPEVFEREVLHRHELAHQSPQSATDATAMADRAWLARVVAAHTTRSGSPEPDKDFDESLEREALRRHQRPQRPDQAHVLDDGDGDDDAAAVAADRAWLAHVVAVQAAGKACWDEP
jgi:hypothetical protein